MTDEETLAAYRRLPAEIRTDFGSDTLADLERARSWAVTLEQQNAELTDALRLVGRHGCTNGVLPSTCVNSGRTRGAEYADEKWCDGCIATVALAACDGIPE